MGQQEVYQFLKKKKDYVPTEEICSSLNSNYNQVIRALATMFRFGEVSKKQIIKEVNDYQRKISLWRLR